MRRPVLPPRLLVLVTGLLLASPSPAQVVEGVDVGAARARAKAQAQAGELEAFTIEVNRRAERLRREAEQTRAAALANRARLRGVAPPAAVARGAGGINLDELLAQSNQLGDERRDPRPRFIAFASLSMPPAALRQMIRDVGRAGGVIVFQGFPANSMRRFAAGLARVVDRKADLGGLGIDPRLFRAFRVTAVPAYVVVSTDFEVCDGFRCATALPPHDRMTGNVTPAYALATFVEGRGPGAAAARVYLRRLRGGGA